MRSERTNTAGSRVERKHASIVAAAADVFLQRGFSGASMDEVAAAACVSKQTVYAHFTSKETLFLEIMRSMMEDATREVAEKVADPDDDAPLETFLSDYAARLLAVVLTPRLMQLRRLVIAEAERFPQLGRALHVGGPARSIDRLARIFERQARLGRLRARDPRVAASFFNWLVMGAPVNDAMMLPGDPLPSAKARAAHGKEAVRIFLAAYGVDGRASR